MANDARTVGKCGATHAYANRICFVVFLFIITALASTSICVNNYAFSVLIVFYGLMAGFCKASMGVVCSVTSFDLL